MKGKGATRIGTIFANAPGAHACRGICYLREVGKAFDHCPVLARIEAGAFKDIIFTVARPISLTIPDLPKGKEEKTKRASADVPCTSSSGTSITAKTSSRPSLLAT